MKKKDFLQKYNLTESAFRKGGIKWNDLLEISQEFFQKADKYLQIAQSLSNSIANVPNVHSTRLRVKNPYNLIEKIIRKNSDKDRDVKIDKTNYTVEITDLVGVRALHLYKKDWKEIDFFIKKNWDLLETPKAYFREGDDKVILDMYRENGCEILQHPFGYRSIHYIIKIEISKEIQSICEIQVRTIFEEGWSEIDHIIRYPYMTKDKILAGYLGLLNKICGSADDMATFIDAFVEKYKMLKKENFEYAKKTEELETKINELSIEADDKDKLISELKSLKTKKESSYTYETYFKTCRKCGKPITGLSFGLADDDLCFNCSNLENNWALRQPIVTDSFLTSTLKKTCKICGKEYEVDYLTADFGVCSDCTTIGPRITY